MFYQPVRTLLTRIESDAPDHKEVTNSKKLIEPKSTDYKEGTPSSKEYRLKRYWSQRTILP
jgi:hypothetical protein